MKSNTDIVNIMIVDDDEVDKLAICKEFEKLFNKNVFQFYCANNGVEALNKLYGKNGENKLTPPPDAILLDIRMPKMNGFEFLKKLREDPVFNKTPVYLLTYQYGTNEKMASQNLGVAGRIVKPLQHNDALTVYMKIVAHVV